MVLDKEDIKHLRRIIEYLYEDERKHCEETYDGQTHIFVSVKHLDNLLNEDKAWSIKHEGHLNKGNIIFKREILKMVKELRDAGPKTVTKSK